MESASNENTMTTAEVMSGVRYLVLVGLLYSAVVALFMFLTFTTARTAKTTLAAKAHPINLCPKSACHGAIKHRCLNLKD